MPLPSPTAASDMAYNTSLANLTAGTVAYLPITKPGRIKRMGVVAAAAVATGPATFQLAYAPPGSSTFTNIASGLVTLPNGQAAGQTVNQDLTPSNDAYVTDGGTLRITAGGTATGGGAPTVTINLGA